MVIEVKKSSICCNIQNEISLFRTQRRKFNETVNQMLIFIGTECFKEFCSGMEWNEML